MNSKEITALAWAWVDTPEDVTCYLLGESRPQAMLRAFRAAYAKADVVTGHFIRGFDLPLINGALTEYQMPTLDDKLASDTKLDLVRRHGLSGSQENLGAMLGLVNPKVKMDQAKWRSANRLTKAGRELARERVCGDVRQHIEMRRKLIELGYLGAPVLWRGGTAPLETYTP
jgi:DNA polymerase elongation subunit (family B)